ncbi:MAG: adenylosuccinate synthetase, partial [Elusimicrobiaceae bacterium]|nr:adenylosuccinate synthetase [Elusimicrobiaceae bacterium]
MIVLVCGGQAGDEGKGKIAAYLSYKGSYDYCVRVGGPNAGHTVVQNGVSYTLKNIPSGFLNPKTKLVLGAGAYTKTEWLLDEVKKTGTQDRLIIDPYAVLITDEQTAAERGAAHFMSKIGSVGTGLGQAVKERIERREIKFAKDE